MENSKAYYKLTELRNKLEEKLEVLDNQIIELREQGRKLKKGSDERKELNRQVNLIKNSDEYKQLKLELQTMNLCINIVFYN